MAEATLTSKGQMTIPKEIRDKLGLQPRDRVHFTLLPDGTVILRAKKCSLADLHGLLDPPEERDVSLQDMHGWRR